MPALVAAAVLASFMPSHLVPRALPDDASHFCAYAVLAAGAIVTSPSRRSTVVRLLFLLCLGTGIEVLQPTFHRAAEATDIFANVAGLVAGGLMVPALRRLPRPRPRARARADQSLRMRGTQI